MSDPVLPPLGTPEEFHQMLVDLANGSPHAGSRSVRSTATGSTEGSSPGAWRSPTGHCSVATSRFRSGVSPTAESALRLLSRTGRRLRLIWIDARPVDTRV